MNNIMLYLKDLIFNTNYGDFMGFLLVILIVMAIVGILIVYQLTNKYPMLNEEALTERIEENNLTFAFFFLFEAIAFIFGIIALLYGLAWLFF